MKFRIERSSMDGKITFSGEISEYDLVRLHLDPLDRALMRDIESGKNVTSADHLLVLEMLFRRSQEQLYKQSEADNKVVA